MEMLVQKARSHRGQVHHVTYRMDLHIFIYLLGGVRLAPQNAIIVRARLSALLKEIPRRWEESSQIVKQTIDHLAQDECRMEPADMLAEAFEHAMNNVHMDRESTRIMELITGLLKKSLFTEDDVRTLKERLKKVMKDNEKYQNVSYVEQALCALEA